MDIHTTRELNVKTKSLRPISRGNEERNQTRRTIVRRERRVRLMEIGGGIGKVTTVASSRKDGAFASKGIESNVSVWNERLSMVTGLDSTNSKLSGMSTHGPQWQ